MKKKAIIIGGGPAGLTAAIEFLEKTDIEPIVLEKDNILGGIARTINYKGNRIDIGGHRFFSKSDTVMDFWKKYMPPQGQPARDEIQLKLDVSDRMTPGGPDPEKEDRVMLIRNRLSRIYYLKKFFNYPINLSWNTLANLGPVRIARIGLSYLWARLFPRKKEESLEDFFINRFGKELYLTFFKEYTEKVWGIACNKIKAEWGAQRIKGLSITKTVMHALKSLLPKKHTDINQKETETSLIEKFLYPKLGPGQMWETVAKTIQEKGGAILMEREVVGIEYAEGKITALTIRHSGSGQEERIEGDYFLSSMPMKDLFQRMQGSVPDSIRNIANHLEYRDFITVGLLLKKLAIKNTTKYPTVNNIVPDNWIYIQEPGVKVGRLQIFNNWSPYMVQNPDTVWVGMEYFVNEGDELWRMKDEDFKRFAAAELSAIGIINQEDVLDSTIIRVLKAYPSYTGEGYEQFDTLKDFADAIPNLFLVGRNGMHRYNNQDHSMLASMKAVELIASGSKEKSVLWQVNAEKEYHEEKK